MNNLIPSKKIKAPQSHCKPLKFGIIKHFKIENLI